jgi:hypothetical protein
MAQQIKKEQLPQPAPIFKPQHIINQGEGPLPAPAGSSYPALPFGNRFPISRILPNTK